MKPLFPPTSKESEWHNHSPSFLSSKTHTKKSTHTHTRKRTQSEHIAFWKWCEGLQVWFHTGDISYTHTHTPTQWRMAKEPAASLMYYYLILVSETSDKLHWRTLFTIIRFYQTAKKFNIYFEGETETHVRSLKYIYILLLNENKKTCLLFFPPCEMTILALWTYVNTTYL